MTSPLPLSVSPSKMVESASSSGLHINPLKTRPPSASLLRRVSSDTSFVTHHLSTSKPVPPSPLTPLSDDVFLADGEKTPLITKNHVTQFDESMHSHMSEGGNLSVGAAILKKAKTKGPAFWLQVVKILVLFAITLLCCTVLVGSEETQEDLHEVIARETPQVIFSQGPGYDYPVLQLSLMGPVYENTSDTADNSTGGVQVDIGPGSQDQQTPWVLGVNRTLLISGALTEVRHQFRCSSTSVTQCNMSLRTTERELSVPLVYSVHELSEQVDHETVYAALILLFVYVLIIFELVHRTLAAMLGALAALAVLSAINERPTTETIIGWMEMETLMLLFGMMIIVAVLSDTGIFDYSALKAYKVAQGRVWPLVTLLCLFSAVVSAFLDNVTTILLMAPVTIRLCEVLNLEPRVILIAEVLFSNIGGTATAIGDPPNVIIVGTLENDGITFTVFTGHLVIGILFTTVVAYAFMRLYYRDIDQLSNPEPPDIAELNREIEMWRRTASRLVVVTREETLMRALFLQKAVELENLLNRKLHRNRKAEINNRNEQLRRLEAEYQIKDVGLLCKCIFVLTVVLLFFFMYSFVEDIHIGLGWVAVLGAMWLLVIADVSDMESILHRVEWSTLLFFSALFILMEALAELGLMEWIGEQMRSLILEVEVEYRLTAALCIIVWVSALASSFIDNIPYTTAMIPVLKQLSEDEDVDLQLLPLVMALAFGACLGGNGTLIGASANVVCAGIAEQHGYTITFKQFFKIGFPMMLVTTFTASIYLLICHSAIKWNDV